MCGVTCAPSCRRLRLCVCVFIWTPLSAKDFCRLWLWAILTNQILNSLRLAPSAPRSPTLLFVTLIVLFDRCWYKSSMQAILCVTFLPCLLMLCRVTPGVQPGGHSAAAYVWNAFAINFMRSSFLFTTNRPLPPSFLFLLLYKKGHFDESDSQFTSTRALGAQVPDVTLRDAHCLV